MTADTPDELAAAMEAEFGVPAANMADTLRTFNAHDRSDRASSTRPGAATTRRSRRRRCARSPASRASRTRWAASRSTPTCASPREQLDGVFAAGADAGNVFEDVYGGGLGWAAVSGRRAGRAAAARATTVNVPVTNHV